MRREHCWKFTRCGREPGGQNASELGVCKISMHHVVENHLGVKNTGKGCAYASRIFDFEHFMADTEELPRSYYMMPQHHQFNAPKDHNYIYSFDEE